MEERQGGGGESRRRQGKEKRELRRGRSVWRQGRVQARQGGGGGLLWKRGERGSSFQFVD